MRASDGGIDFTATGVAFESTYHVRVKALPDAYHTTNEVDLIGIFISGPVANQGQPDQGHANQGTKRTNQGHFENFLLLHTDQVLLALIFP